MPYADPEKQRAYFKAYHAKRYLEKKEEIRAKNDAWREANKERVASRVYEWKLENVYGITREQYDAILEAQSGRCALCFADEPGGSGKWHVDHCHDGGGVRGLLCLRCNVGLGNFRDDPDLLWSAIEYLHDPPARDIVETPPA